MGRIGRLELATLLAVLLVFVLWQGSHLLRPGLYCDESFDAVLTLDIVKNLLQRGGSWPLRLREYHTALQSYFLTPFFLAIRSPALALRSAELVFALTVLASTYFFLRALVGRTAALLTLFLLAVNPAFILMSRVGVTMGSIMVPFAMASLWCLLRWHRGGGQVFLWAGAFLLGAGSCIKVWFFWLPAALLVTALARRQQFCKRLDLASSWRAALAFAAGSAFLWIPELFGGLPTTHYILSHFPRTGNGDADNLAILRNLAMRAGQLAKLAAGMPEDPDWLMPPNYLQSNAAAVVGHGLLLSCAIALARRPSPLRAPGQAEKSSGLAIVLLIMMGFSLYTVSDYRQDHLFLLFPLLEAMVALGALSAAAALRDRGSLWAQASGAAFLGALGLSLLWQASMLYRVEGRLSRTGGEGYLSDAVIQVADWLERNGIEAPKCCDWGMHDSLRLLSRGKIKPIPCYGGRDRGLFGGQPVPADCLTGDNVYLFLPPAAAEETNYGRYNRQLRARGERFVERQRFYRRDGQLAYLACERRGR